MAKLTSSKQPAQPDWYLAEWMHMARISQAEMSRRTGWSRATVNDLVHGRTNYYRERLNEAAVALHCQPYELLLPPEEAMALRRIRESSIRIAAESRLDYRFEPTDTRKVA